MNVAVALVAGSPWRHERNFTRAKLAKRMARVEASIAHYLEALDHADQAEDEIAQAKAVRLEEKIAALRERMQALRTIGGRLEASPDPQISLTDPDARAMSTTSQARDDRIFACCNQVEMSLFAQSRNVSQAG
jgi:hypothetical protein